MKPHDSILLENSVSFYKDKSNSDAIRFTLKVTNRSNSPIPDLGVENRSKFVNFYINGVANPPLSLFNGIERIDGDKTIPIGSSQEFEFSRTLSSDEKEEFTVQWEYGKRRSKIVRVNIKSRTIEILK